MRDLIDNARIALGEANDVAIERAHDFPHALRLREGHMFRKMYRLAMGRHGYLRFQPRVHLGQFRPTRMAGHVDKVSSVGDDLDTLTDEAVHDPANGLFIARNRA